MSHPRDERFGNCRVVEQIASGPLTDVFRAVQEPAGQRVVVKALRRTIAPLSPFSERVAHEARVLARLHHRGIVTLHDFVRDDGGAYLVLEDVDGPPLAALIRRAGRVSLEAALAIALEMARALAHAHAAGVVHRGLDPSNVVLSRTGEVKLVDFGAAEAPRSDEGPEPIEPGQTLASPSYMSPEQVLGEDVDGRTDLFAVGVMLFEMVSGRRPFDGTEERSTAQRVRHDDPDLSTDGGAELPRDVERIVLRCLEKAPSDRFASSAELRAAVEAALRARTSASTTSIVSAELVRSRLVAPGDANALDRARDVEPSPERASVLPSLWGYLTIVILLVSGAIVIQRGARGDDDASGARRGAPLELSPAEAAQLRIVARPWARVSIDGQPVDTTPIARAIPLAPGMHFLTFEHPNSPPERRTMRFRPGESVLLDVTMQVAASPVDAGVDARAVEP